MLQYSFELLYLRNALNGYRLKTMKLDRKA